MSWVTSSFLMFGSSVITYLLIRKQSLLKVSSQVNNLAMFALPGILLLFIAVVVKADLSVSLYEFGILVILAIFFSYLGNMMSLKSIEYAPNPGYSLVLSKSYVVFTSIASIFVFDSPLTKRSVLSILLIVVFSALIMINKRKEKKQNQKLIWLPLAIGAFFCWGMLSLTSKYLLNLGVGIYARLIYSMVMVTFLILIEIKITEVKVKLHNKLEWLIFILVGIFWAACNYFMQLGFQLAPNIGYVNAVNASSIAVVTIFSGIIFKDELNIRKVIGVVGVIVGLILLVI